MSLRPLNLGWLLVMLLLGQELVQAQLRRLNRPTLPGQANALTLIWSPSPSPEVVGYSLYWGLSEDSCTNRIVVLNETNATLVGFRRRVTYHLAVAAYDVTGEESPWSNSIQYSRPSLVMPVIPPGTATNLLQLQQVSLTSTNRLIRLSFTAQTDVSYQLQATEDFQRWDDLCTTNCEQPQLVVYDLPYSVTTSHRFFRLLQE
jgi:hypothetical protein